MNLKYSLGVMGCRPYIYWLGTFCFDYILFLIIFLYFLFINKYIDEKMMDEVTKNEDELKYITCVNGIHEYILN